MNSREQRRRYFEAVREIHVAGLGGCRILSQLFDLPKATILRWLKAEGDLKTNHLADADPLKAEAKRRFKAGEQIQAIAASLEVSRNTVAKWVAPLKLRRLRATERGLSAYNLKLVREGYTLDQRIKLLDQAEAAGYRDVRVIPCLTEQEWAEKKATARQLRALGWAHKAIAAHMGFSLSAIQRWTRDVKCPVNHRPRRQVGWKQRAYEVRYAA